MAGGESRAAARVLVGGGGAGQGAGGGEGARAGPLCWVPSDPRCGSAPPGPLSVTPTSSCAGTDPPPGPWALGSGRWVPVKRGPSEPGDNDRPPCPPAASAPRPPQRVRHPAPWACVDWGMEKHPALPLRPLPRLNACPSPTQGSPDPPHRHCRPRAWLTARVARPGADASPPWGRPEVA